MISINEVSETNQMIQEEKLDVRTITMGISLLDCCDKDVSLCCENIRAKIFRSAKNLTKVGDEVSSEYGIPIVHKRISVTPISLVGASCCKTIGDYVQIARTLDDIAKELNVNFIGGYSAIVNKSMTENEALFISSLPIALSQTERVCTSLNVASSRTGINMNAVRLSGHIIKTLAYQTKDQNSIGCAKLVIFCNAPDDNPFMAGAFHGISE